jgi:tetratricopeptide (TPR) repeat protein
MSPVIGSKPDQLLRKNPALCKKVWLSLDLPLRASINNLIISKSLNKAIKEKNESYAYRVAGFARSVNSNVQSGLKMFDWSMLTYYKGINDTSNYFKEAIRYYDKYYMTVKPDSIKLKDTLTMIKLRDQTTGTVEKRGDSLIKKKQITYSPATQRFTNELNNAAWNFYIMTQNTTYLQKALAWSRRANEFFASFEAMDTYARLLYKTGNKNEAIEWLNKAILLKKSRGFGTQEFDSILQKMKNNSIKIDNY